MKAKKKRPCRHNAAPFFVYRADRLDAEGEDILVCAARTFAEANAMAARLNKASVAAHGQRGPLFFVESAGFTRPWAKGSDEEPKQESRAVEPGRCVAVGQAMVTYKRWKTREEWNG